MQSGGKSPQIRAKMHGPGYPANAHKVRTRQWQYFGGTSTHRSLPLDETASKYWVARSRNEYFCENSCPQEFYFWRLRKCFQKSTKIIKNRGAESRNPSLWVCDPTHYGSATLPPNKVGAKCLSAVVLDNQDRAFRLRPSPNQHRSESQCRNFCIFQEPMNRSKYAYMSFKLWVKHA